MASLGEMLQYANYISEINNPLAGILKSGLSGYSSGIEEKKQKERENLDTFVKLIDIQDKLAKTEIEKQKLEIEKNKAKAFNWIPLDEDETTNAQVQGFQNIGAGKNKPKDNSSLGRLNQFFDMSEKYGYDSTANYNSRNGFGFTVKKKQKEKDVTTIKPTERIALQEKIRTQAQKMALSEVMQKLSKNWDPIEKGVPLNAINAAPYVTEDIVNKYLKPAELFLTGKQGEYQKVIEEISKKIKEEDDPLGLGLK
jgi:hypothetical protein